MNGNDPRPAGECDSGSGCDGVAPDREEPAFDFTRCQHEPAVERVCSAFRSIYPEDESRLGEASATALSSGDMTNA